MIAQNESADPGGGLVRGRKSGSQVVENAGSGVSAVELDGDEFGDAGEHVVDANVLLHSLEEARDLPHSIQSDPYQVPHQLSSPCRLVDGVPWKAAKKFRNEAGFRISRSNVPALVNHLVSLHISVGHEKLKQHIS